MPFHVNFCHERCKLSVASACKAIYIRQLRQFVCKCEVEDMKKKLAAAIIVLCAAKKKRRRSCWVRKWIARRPKFGAYASLLTELVIEDPGQYKKFLRMTPALLEELLTKVGPVISKKETKLREPIPAKEKLALTLRFLASGKSQTKAVLIVKYRNSFYNLLVNCMKRVIHIISGDSYASLAFAFRIPQCTISRFVPEVCSAIFEQLKEDFLQVSYSISLKC